MFALFRRASSFGQDVRRPRPASPARAGLHVEQLEDRCTPTTVMNLGDAAGDPNSLRGAIAATPAGGIVDFAPGLTGTIPLTTAAGGQITVAKSLTIQGPGAAAVTVQAAPNTRIFNLNSAGSTVGISGLTLTGGNVSGGGGAISSVGDTLTVANCVVTGNAGASRGALYQQNGSLTVLNCTISGNTSGASGGGVRSYGAVVTLMNSTISGNMATGAGGGGVKLVGPGVKQIIGCTIANNTSN